MSELVIYKYSIYLCYILEKIKKIVENILRKVKHIQVREYTKKLKFS